VPATLRHLLHRRFEAVRRALIARHALRALAAAALLLALAVLAGVARGGGTTLATARLSVFALGVLVAIVMAVRALHRELPAFDAWLEGIERRFPELRSWLRNSLDLESRPSPHTSEELADALRGEAAKRLDATPLAAERPAIRPRGPLFATLGAAGAMLVLALLLPDAAMRSWHTLWDPAAAAPPVTLAVEPGSVTISPGAALAVRARVAGTTAPPRLLGEGASPAPELEGAEGGVQRWRFDLPPVTRARTYAVRVQRVVSPRYSIALVGEPQPVAFSFEYRAPAYARLPAQSGAATRGDLAALRGSIASVEVTFDRDVEAVSARLPGGRGAAWSALTPRRWRGQLRIDQDGEWTLRAEAASGAGEFRYRVSALADAPPVVTVALPQGDQDLPAGSQVPYDVMVQDDLGLSDLKLQFRKGAGQPWRDVPLAGFHDQPREAHAAANWDAAALALLPGEAGTFRFQVRDNNRVSGPGVGVSPEFRLRFPSLTELYTKLDRGQEHVQQTLQQVAEQARELQKSLDQLQRQQPRPGAQSTPAFERSEELRKALERQKSLAQQVEQAAQEMNEHMADAAERQAFREQLQQKLREMSELMRQIQSPDFKDALQRMQKALQEMDRRAMEQVLPQLRDQNKDMLKNLERSLALLKQLRDEEKLDALSKRAEELKAQQDALNKEHSESPSPPDSRDAQARAQDLAQRQQQAADKTRQLAEDARQSSEQMSGEDSKQDLQDAAQDLEQQAAPQQKEASQQSQSGQPKKAASAGQKASESLQRAAQKMNQSNEAAQRERDAQQLAAVRHSAQDLVSLGQEAAQGQQGTPAPESQAGRQTDISEGVSRVADSLAALSKKTPVLSPKIQASLGRAMNGFSNSGHELSQGNRARGEQEASSARAALNEAVNGLREAESSMCNKPGQNGQGQGQSPGGAQRMRQLGSQQGQLNQRSRELAKRLSQQMRISAGDQAEMRQLADEQARIRAELESVQRDEAARHELLGRLDQTKQDMQEVEEHIRSGQLGDEVQEQQTHILSRMLDAQRSINRRDYDPEREAHRGEDVARSSPGDLPAALLRENDRLRLDLMKADADRYPAQYRALIERYLQRLNGSPR